ncbi:MAG TPA: branched-chain amino acid ABC transporter permease [Polyangiaceae bacterium]|nr:branched-chain amino acid ABC transporter permease [Polyangiaceae bacterium]HYQ26186.1 branched-chain amino acid ABC transporter permease [Polyangiaceae bacterium]
MRALIRIAITGAVLLAILALQLAVQAAFTEYVQRIVLLAGINVILAVGLNLINGTTGQFSIGHAGFMAVGAYGAAFVGVKLATPVHAALGPGVLADALIFNLALLAGALFAGVSGLIVGMPSLRLRGDYLAVVTLGFGEIIRILFNNATFLGSATGYFGDDPSGLPAYTNFFWVFAWAVAIIAVIHNLTFSQTGRSLTAIREDEIAAEAMATPTTRLKVTAFAISAATAGIAGGLFAHMQAGVRPEDFRFEKSIDMIVMIIVGGLGSISGAILGGIFVAVSLELMRDLQQYRLVLYALLLIVIMIVRPEGVLGTRELHHLFRRKKPAPPSPPSATPTEGA